MIADAWHDLEDELLGPEPAYDGPEIEPVDDAVGADRHLAWLRRIDAALAVQEEVAQAELERITAYLDRRRAEAASKRLYHEQVLERYHRAVLSSDARRKTIKLPHGTLRARAQQPVWEWAEDGDVFGRWVAENRPDLLEQLVDFPTEPPPPRLLVNAAKQALTVEEHRGSKVVARTFGKFEDGTAPEGVTVTERGDKFDVVLTDDEIDP